MPAKGEAEFFKSRYSIGAAEDHWEIRGSPWGPSVSGFKASRMNSKEPCSILTSNVTSGGPRCLKTLSA